MASVVVVAEASVLEAVVVAFGGADDVLSVLPQAVMLIIVARIIKAAMAFIVFFIWFSSFLDLTYSLKSSILEKREGKPYRRLSSVFDYVKNNRNFWSRAVIFLCFLSAR